MRGDMGGLFLGIAVFALWGAAAGSARLLTVPAAFLGFIVLGRTLSLIVDGRSDGARSLAVELLLLAFVLLPLFSLRHRQQHRVGGGRFLLFIPVLAVVLMATGLLFQRPLGMALMRRTLQRSFQGQFFATLPDGLHAGLCGSGSPLPDATRAGPCVFVIAGEHMYVVDAGEGSPRKLALMGLPAGIVDGIFITHFHSDHIGGLGEMMLQRWTNTGHSEPVPVFGPQGVEQVVNGYNDAYRQDAGFRVAHHGAETMPPAGTGGTARPFTLEKGSGSGQVVLQVDGLTVTAFGVDHTPVFPAAGYRFDYKARSIVVSGDTAPSATLEKYSKGVDVLFHEGLQTTMVQAMHDGAVEYGRKTLAKITADIPSYHTRPEDAARIAQRAGVRYLMFYHTIPPLPVSYLNAVFLGDAPAIYRGPITVGKDGMMLSMPPGGTAVMLRELL